MKRKVKFKFNDFVFYVPFKKAEDALKFFKGFTGKDPREIEAINKEMERLKCIIKEQNNAEKLKLSDFCKFEKKNTFFLCFFVFGMPKQSFNFNAPCLLFTIYL